MSKQLYTTVSTWEIWIEEDKVYCAAADEGLGIKYQFPTYEAAVRFAELN